jgi:hypothetical protein
MALPQPDERVRDAAAVLRLRLPREAEGLLDEALAPDRLLARVGDAVFFAEVFFAAVFFAAAGLLAVDFFAAADLLAVDVPAVVLLAVDLLAVDLPAVDLAAAFFAPPLRFAAAAFVPPALAVPAFAVPALDVPAFAVPALDVPDFAVPAPVVVFRAGVRPDFVSAAPRVSPAAPPALPFRSCPRGCVSQATAAPVAATGHSTSPATPSTPAPV